MGAASAAAMEAQGYAKSGIDYLEDKRSSGESKTDFGSEVSETLADAATGSAVGLAVGGVAGAAVGAGLGTLVGIGSSIYHHFF